MRFQGKRPGTKGVGEGNGEGDGMFEYEDFLHLISGV